MIFHDVEQNTDEWFDLRLGKLGGSSIGKIMANYGKTFGDPAKKLAVSLSIEQLTGIRQGANFTNEHMDRGHLQEPIARAMYEAKNFCTVSNGGFFDSEDIEGVSPDGLVDDDGAIEIKSVIATTHFNVIKRNSYDTKYKWQLFYNLKVTGREWIDFVSYCSEFPEGRRLFTSRIYACDAGKEFEKIDIRVAQFKELMRETKNIIRG